jgi:muramoyltetrapeptide carboxypeptidase
MPQKNIYIYSPAGAVRDVAAFRRGVKRLQSWGHDVVVDPAALKSHQRFAGDDDERVAAVERAVASGADVALMTRGGYGLTRILNQLPYAWITQRIGQHMHWVGYSDFTAMQMALMAQQPLIDGRCTYPRTWAGPALCADFGVDPTLAPEGEVWPDDIMEACFNDVLTDQAEGTGWRIPLDEAKHLTTLAQAAGGASDAPALHIEDAVLWGGNLSVLANLVGTPWLPDVQGGILFLEDVNEHPYRIERLLTQLLGAGILTRQRAVVLGQFSDYKLAPQHDRGFDLKQVVRWLRTQLATPTVLNPHGVPVLTGLPFGHVSTKVMLPVGARVDLLVQHRDALLLWDEHPPEAEPTSASSL